MVETFDECAERVLSARKMDPARFCRELLVMLEAVGDLRIEGDVGWYVIGFEQEEKVRLFERRGSLR